MGTREKVFIPDNTYFITFTILGWQQVFTSERYFNLVYQWFDYVKDKYGDDLYGYAIMPNHIHVLLYVSQKSPNISKLVQNAKRFLAYGLVDLLEEDKRADLLEFFASQAKTDKGAKHRVFTDRFDSKLMDADLFWEKLEYIHNNPCQEKWGLATAPEDYPHSSAANYILGQGKYDVKLTN